jgi:hypothetical protein
MYPLKDVWEWTDEEEAMLCDRLDYSLLGR